MQNIGFLKAFWRLTKPYWVSEQRAKGLTLLATVVGLALMAVYMEVQFTNWNNDFYNTLQDKDQAEFFRQLGKFGLLAFTWIIIVVYQRYFQQMLLIEWRAWLTDHFLAGWMKDQAHYRMQLVARTGAQSVAVDNPDQRIADDLRMFVDMTLSLSIGLLRSVVTLPPVRNCCAMSFATSIGMAKDSPMKPPVRLYIWELIPTTSPRRLNSGPPELPGLTATSVWMNGT